MAFGFINTSGKTNKKDFIPISTGDISCPYEVIDTIFALDSDREGVLRGADPNSAFKGVKEHLRKKCKSLGGDAVIFCRFQYQAVLGDGSMPKKQIVEIFAYGTAVKFIDG